MVRQCEWCGNNHSVKQLCQARPKWGRRGFLVMMGMAAAATVIGQLPPPEFDWRDPVSSVRTSLIFITCQDGSTSVHKLVDGEYSNFIADRPITITSTILEQQPSGLNSYRYPIAYAKISIVSGDQLVITDIDRLSHKG